MVVCMMMELALNEDINNAEEGETTICHLQGAGSSLHRVCHLLRDVGKMKRVSCRRVGGLNSVQAVAQTC